MRPLPALRRCVPHSCRSFVSATALDVTADQVLITVGGAHALYCAFHAVLDPGTECLLFSPYWTPIADMIRGTTEAHPVYVPTSVARRTGITAALEQLVTPATRAIYYNTPQNPSGVVFTRAEAEEVAEPAKRHDLVVISDEAYEDLVYEGEHVSIGSLPAWRSGRFPLTPSPRAMR